MAGALSISGLADVRMGVVRFVSMQVRPTTLGAIESEVYNAKSEAYIKHTHTHAHNPAAGCHCETKKKKLLLQEAQRTAAAAWCV